MNVYKFTNPYDDKEVIDVVLIKNNYVADGSLAVTMVDVNTGECWDTITVCIPEEGLANETLAFVNTNHCPTYSSWLIKSDVAELTGCIGFSGFCQYPLMRFNLDKLNTQEELEEYFNGLR